MGDACAFPHPSASFSQLHKQEEPEDGEIALPMLSLDSHRTCTCPNHLSKLQCGMGMGECLTFSVYWLLPFLIVVPLPQVVQHFESKPVQRRRKLGGFV